jgi:predicted transcriptional regulator
MFDVVISLTDEQKKRAEALAHAEGYAGPNEYLHALVEDALDDENTDEEIIAALKDSLREMKRGEGMTVEEFRRWITYNAG